MTLNSNGNIIVHQYKHTMKIGLVIVVVVIVLILIAMRVGREGYMPYKPDEIVPPPRMYLPDPGFYPVSVYFAPAFP